MLEDTEEGNRNDSVLSGGGMSAYLGCLYVALLEDLLQDLVLVRGAELILKCSLACGVEDTLVAVPNVS